MDLCFIQNTNQIESDRAENTNRNKALQILILSPMTLQSSARAAGDKMISEQRSEIPVRQTDVNFLVCIDSNHQSINVLPGLILIEIQTPIY